MLNKERIVKIISAQEDSVPKAITTLTRIMRSQAEARDLVNGELFALKEERFNHVLVMLDRCSCSAKDLTEDEYVSVTGRTKVYRLVNVHITAAIEE